MKKILYTIALFLLLSPASSLAKTITTNVENVPLHLNMNNSQVLISIPNATAITKLSSNGEWYQVTYGENTGWIDRAYTVEGLAEKKSEKKDPETSSSYGYNGDVAVPSNTKNKMDRIVTAVNKYSKTYNLNPNLVLALIKVESSFNPNAHSSANCRGLMQISYRYAESWNIDKNRLYEIEYNIAHGTRILRTQFINKMGNLYDGLRAYNQGVAGAQKNPNNGKSYADKIMKYYNNYKTNGFPY